MATIASLMWRDPRVVHDILNFCGGEQVHICPACVKSGTDACPNLGKEPVGICEGYAFAEKDPGVEARVHEHLLANVERINAARRRPAQSSVEEIHQHG